MKHIKEFFTAHGCNTKGDVSIIAMVMGAVVVGTVWEWVGL